MVTLVLLHGLPRRMMRRPPLLFDRLSWVLCIALCVCTVSKARYAPPALDNKKTDTQHLDYLTRLSPAFQSTMCSRTAVQMHLVPVVL